MSYHELSVTEHTTIQIGLLNSMSQRRIARLLDRSPPTISREIRRNRSAQGRYVTHEAQHFMRARRQACHPHRKLEPGNERFDLMVHLPAPGQEHPQAAFRRRGSPRDRLLKGVNIHLCPPEMKDHLMPDHWEGDLIKGNASAVGTLVERTSGDLGDGRLQHRAEPHAAGGAQMFDL
ncbi:hypothetical protein GCM10027514_06660 [Azotobacter armeniacus]